LTNTSTIERVLRSILWNCRILYLTVGLEFLVLNATNNNIASTLLWSTLFQDETEDAEKTTDLQEMFITRTQLQTANLVD